MTIAMTIFGAAFVAQAILFVFAHRSLKEAHADAEYWRDQAEAWEQIAYSLCPQEPPSPVDVRPIVDHLASIDFGEAA